jgi:protein O-GlcNAc transferase
MTTPTEELLERATQERPNDAEAWFHLGAHRHENGQLPGALEAFRGAAAQAPDNLQIASAIAAVLMDMNLPAQAYATLQMHRATLVKTADGAFNLAVTAEAANEPLDARMQYELALRLDPNHVGALRNMAALLSALRTPTHVAQAVALARRAVAQAPADPRLWANLAEFLTQANDPSGAREATAKGLAISPDDAELQVRHAVATAMSGDIAQADALFATLETKQPGLLAEFLRVTTHASDRPVPKPAMVLPDADEIFLEAGFEAMRRGDWRNQAAQTAHFKSLIARVRQTQEPRDWRDAQFYALLLDMSEDDQSFLVETTRRTGLSLIDPLKPLALPPPRADGRLRLGILAQTLDDARYRLALANQLAHHDRNRWHITVYSPTPKPTAAADAPVAAHCDQIAHIAAFTAREAAQRIRLDKLDALLDHSFYSPWCRPEIYWHGVAPVQTRHLTWQRHLAFPGYQLSDAVIHPVEPNHAPRYQNVVRLPGGVWLPSLPMPPALGAASGTALDTTVTREALGLPANGAVFAAFNAALRIDPDTFAAWMAILQAVPNAVLWTNAPPSAVLPHWQREMQAAGVHPDRLVFVTPQHIERAKLEDARSALALADIFLDSFRFNANQTLVDALSMGVPGLSVAGNNMASRLGASLLTHGGCAEGVCATQEEYVKRAIALGQDATARQAMRQRLAANRASAPLFDLPSRVKDLENALSMMVSKARAGLPPEGFDL